MKIKSIRKIDYSGDVYNLRIKSDDGLNHNYIANGINVSNCHKARGNSIGDILESCVNWEYKLGLSGTMKIDLEYSDFYTIGLNNATSATAVSLGKQLNTGGVTLQSSTDAWGGDGTIRTLKVLVSAAGVVTATIDGVAPTAPLALTFDNADVVMPFIHFLHDTTTPGEIALLSLKCGFQA